MVYRFNQSFTPLEAEILALLPQQLSSAALNVINTTVSTHPSATQKDVLQALYNNVTAHGGSAPNVMHADLYLYVFAELSQANGSELVPKTELAQNEQSAWLWVEGAIGVNIGDDTFFSNYIRDQTEKQHELRYGQCSPSGLMRPFKGLA